MCPSRFPQNRRLAIAGPCQHRRLPRLQSRNFHLVLRHGSMHEHERAIREQPEADASCRGKPLPLLQQPVCPNVIPSLPSAVAGPTLYLKRGGAVPREEPQPLPLPFRPSATRLCPSLPPSHLNPAGTATKAHHARGGAVSADRGRVGDELIVLLLLGRRAQERAVQAVVEVTVVASQDLVVQARHPSPPLRLEHVEVGLE